MVFGTHKQNWNKKNRKKQNLKQKMIFLAAVGILLVAGIKASRAGAGFMIDEGIEKTSMAAELPKEDSQAPDTDLTTKEEKVVALTFDDGPDPVYTPILLEGLAKREVKATFFLMGKQAELYPDIVKQMSEDGHQIGNHTYSHVRLNITGENEIMEELERTNDIIYGITGAYPAVFRPPFGSVPDHLEEKIDMAEILWDIDPLDWCTSDAGKVTERIVSKVSDHKIILMHDASQSSINAAFAVIDILQKKGYRFVTVDEIIYE